MVAFATQVKRRRGTAEQNNEFTGAEGEIVVNLTDKSLRVHDGRTKGGFETLRQNMQNSVNITNCITEIPQDIKLEIVDGAVVLKAGSKVYVPNGVGVFDVVDILNDVRFTYSGTTQLILLVSNTGRQPIVSGTQATVSGATDTLSGTTYHTWYDTTNNVINRYNASASEPAYLCSFPIAIATVSNGLFTSIDQVFNGFGYIGGTVFALPGVKGLVPNGRNADGTLNNLNVFNATTVKINTPSDGELDIFLSRWSGYLEISSVGRFIYDAEDNFVKRNSDGVDIFFVFAGKFTKTGGQIIDFYVKPTFHAVDYSEYKNTIDWVRTQTSNVVRLVAEKKATANDSFWYRKYSDGWVEQGGMQEIGVLGQRINFPVPMANKNTYILQLTVLTVLRYACVYTDSERTTTGFKATTADDSIANNDGNVAWYVCGYAAS